jgi:general stress protein 26
MTRSDPSAHDDKLDKIWSLIKDAHSALLVTIRQDGTLDSRPMGCIQREFDGTIWFLTFADSAKVEEIVGNRQVLVSYARPGAYEYVSLSGRARVMQDRQKVRELWSEGLRVWFPSGPDADDLALLGVEVDEAKYWTDAASVATYGWAYVKARVLGQRPTTEQVAEIGSVRL